MNTYRAFIPILLATAVFGCGPAEGPDAITQRQTAPPPSGCNIVCHSATSSISPDPVVTNGTGSAGKHTAHVSEIGLACEKCHLGYDAQITHMNQQPDTGPAVTLVFFDPINPTPPATWNKSLLPARSGICSNLACHGTDTLDWYGTDTSSYQDCVTCHAYAIRSRRQVVGSQGDFGGNASIISHHVTGGDPTNAQCLVCHDQSAHTLGTIRLRHADTGAGIVYDPSNPATLEPFCLSCHDANGATASYIAGGSALNPFNDGAVLGGPPPNLYQAGNKIAGYWNSASNIHKNGGLTCAGSGQPLTGCHGNSGSINMHGSPTTGLLTKRMNFQIPLTFDFASPANTFVYDNYRLCLDCHDSYPRVNKEVVFGYRAGGGYDVWWAPTPYYTPSIQTRFRDRYIGNPANYPIYWGGAAPSYNDNYLFSSDPYIPLHNYHMIGGDIAWPWILSWKYRGNTALVGRITCTTCHNVHGTSGTIASTYEEFGIVAFSGLGIDQYSMLSDPNNYEEAVFKAYPVNCSVSCHGMMGVTSYWQTPSGE